MGSQWTVVLAATVPKALSIITQIFKNGKRNGGNITAYVKKTDNPNMGRPTSNPRTVGLNLRISQSENELLEKCCKLTGRSKTDVVLKGVSLVYKELHKENK